MLPMSNGESLNRVVADCITNSARAELAETLLDKTTRTAILSEAGFTDEEREKLIEIEAVTVEDFYDQAREALGLATKEGQNKGIEKEV